MKNFLMTLLIFLFYVSAIGQGISYGPKLGLNISDIRNANEGSPLIRSHLGIFANKPIVASLSVQGELIYSVQGRMQTGSLPGPIANSYLQLPLMAKYEALNNLHIMAGLQPGIFLRGKIKIKDGVYEGESYSTADVFHNFDFSIVLGAEYALSSGVFFGGRYHWGLTDTHPDETRKGFNRVFSLYVGYPINNLLSR